MYYRHYSLPGYVDSGVAFESENTLPTLNTWTVEGWLKLNSFTATTGANGSWGLLSGQGASAVAGLNWNQYGTATFVWPLAAGGQGSWASSMCGGFGNCPYQHVVIEYDATNITVYINGSLVHQEQPASSAAVTTNTVAGLSDNAMWGSAGMDEFRVSSVARYSGLSITEPGSPFPNNESSTALLWHLDEQGVRKLWQFNAPEAHDFKGMFPDSSGNHHGMEFYSAPHCSISCDSQYRVYALGNGRTAAELDGNGSPWECPCTLSHTDWPVNSATGEFWHTFDDISVPGRGFGLDFSRTYSSQRASVIGPLGYGWSDSYGASLTFATNTVYPRASVVARVYSSVLQK